MSSGIETYRTYGVQAHERAPLVDFMVEALEEAGCRVLHRPEPDRAPFRITFETPLGERMGVLAYAFFANTVLTRNRPQDEHRFQVKYGPDDGEWHELWQDPYELYTTLFLGINPKVGFFVAADPLLHSPTLFFKSSAFKQIHVEETLQQGWASWERSKRQERTDLPVEVLVGGTKQNFLKLVRFERAAKGLAPGLRQLLADKLGAMGDPVPVPAGVAAEITVSAAARHALAEEFELSEAQILDLIRSAPRLKMAVRGWVAEEHLYRQLVTLPGVEGLARLEAEGGADLELSYRGSRPLVIECKNVLRKPTTDGTIRLDLQRTRASKADPCSRFYWPKDFDLIAACLHSRTESWDFRFALPGTLDLHKHCTGRLSNNVRLNGRWMADAAAALGAAAGLAQ